MMRFITCLALLGVATGVLSCRPAADPTGVASGVRVQAAADHPIRLGESIEFTNPFVRVRADSLMDSRCPTNVVCAVAGSVGVLLTAEGDEGRETFSLSLTGETAENEYNAPTVEVLGHSFRLRRVDPYPLFGTDVPDSDYRLILIAR